MKLKIIVFSLSVIMLLSFTACGSQVSNNENSTGNGVSTEEDLPEFTGTVDEEPTTEAAEKSSESGSDDQKEETDFTGLGVEESTEIELEEGQGIEVYN